MLVRPTVLLLGMFSLDTHGQYWERTIGGYDRDVAYDLVERSDGSFLVLGSTGSFGDGGDAYLLCLGADGALIWSRNYGGAGVDEARSIAQRDDLTMVCGSTFSMNDGGYDILLMSVDPNGQVLFERTIGTPDWDLGRAIAAGDGSWMIVGQTYGRGAGDGDMWLLRLTDGGDTLWTRTAGGAGVDVATSVLALPDGSWVVGGSIEMEEGVRAVVMKVDDEDGSMIWENVMPSDSIEAVNGLALTADGDILAVGYSRAQAAYKMMFVARLDQADGAGWRQYYGQIDDFEAFGVTERADGGIAAVGYNKAFGQGGEDTYLLMTDGQGTFQQGLTFGSSEDERGHAVRLTADGGLVFCGSSTGYGPGPESCHVIRTDGAGSTQGAPVIVQLDPLSIPDGSSAPMRIGPIPAVAGSRVALITHLTGLTRWTLRDMRGRPVGTGVVGSHDPFVRIPDVPSAVYLLELVNGSHERVSMRVPILAP